MSRGTAADWRHMKGTRDVSGMAVVCQEGVGCVKMHQDASTGAAAHAWVTAAAGAHEGCVGQIWDGSGTLRRGQACQRAKAEGGIDEKGVRGCGDGERGDSKAEVGRGGSLFSMVSPTCIPQAM